MVTCSGGGVGFASGGDLVGWWGNVRSRLRLTLAAADAEIWGGWRVGAGAWGKGRCKGCASRAAELKPLGPGCLGLDSLAGLWLGERKV
jgi:hypothetical protein